MFIAFAWAGIGLTVAGNVKNYGNIKIGDDKFLTLVGSLGSVANSLARLFWGFLLDKFPFKVIVSINLVCQIVLIDTIALISSNKILFMIYVILLYFFYGGIFNKLITYFHKILIYFFNITEKLSRKYIYYFKNLKFFLTNLRVIYDRSKVI